MGSAGNRLSGQLTLFPPGSFCNEAAMADVINLRLARKARARDKAAQQAALNRAQHGRKAAERQQEQAEADRAARKLDGHKRDQS
ncbi:MAG: hypothetical protein RLZZ415_225 [Pseudomonadota bacterium]